MNTNESFKAMAENTKERSIWQKLRLGFTEYITKPLFTGYGKLEYAKPLSIMQRQQQEIARNKEANKMLSSENGGSTNEEIYRRALEVARSLGWEGKAPTGRADSGAIERIVSENREQESEGHEKIYSFDELSGNVATLHQLWDEAYDKLDAVGNDARLNELMDLTAKNTADQLDRYLHDHDDLTTEERYFIEMSIQTKRFAEKSKDLLVEGSEGEEGVVSEEIYNMFVDTGEVPVEVIEAIARKIAAHESFNKFELSIYSAKASEIEALVQK